MWKVCLAVTARIVLKKAVGALGGVESVAVDLKGKKVTIEFDAEKVSVGDIKDAIEDQGYDVK